jgi:hypothetical protein
LPPSKASHDSSWLFLSDILANICRQAFITSSLVISYDIPSTIQGGIILRSDYFVIPVRIPASKIRAAMPDDEEDDERNCADEAPEEEQTHVHEFLGSTFIAESGEEAHNHRFAGISGEAIKVCGSHIHKIFTRTDFFDHFHFIQRFTGPAVYVDEECNGEIFIQSYPGSRGEGKHVHFVQGFTTLEDGHKHKLQFATLIEAPLLPEEQYF